MSSIDNNDVWDVITSYFNDKGLIHHQVETYNDFIFNKIQKIVDASLPLNFHIEEKNKDSDTNIRKLYNIKFGQVFFNKPECTDNDGSTIKLYPQMARLRKLNYCSSMFVEVIKTEYLIEEKDNITKTTIINEPEVEKIFLGKIPIMLNSDLCNLKGLNKMELANLNEDLNELGGYFIMKGSEKVIIGQERINLNLYFLEC
jgi:DNA-directed RNA polymerase II subunit RPB2